MGLAGDCGRSGVDVPNDTREGEGGAGSLAAGEEPRAGDPPPKSEAKGLMRPSLAVGPLDTSLVSDALEVDLFKGGKGNMVLSLEMI